MHSRKSFLLQSRTNHNLFVVSRGSKWRDSKYNATDCADGDGHERRGFPPRQEAQPPERPTEIHRRVNRARPYWIVERRAQQTDNRGIYATHHGLCPALSAEGLPERQCPNEYKKTRHKYCDEADHCARYPVRRWTHDSPEIGGERKQGSGHCLRGTVASEKCVVAYPSGGNRRLAQKRQHDMSAAKDKGPRSIESFKQRHALRMGQRLQNGQPGKE